MIGTGNPTLTTGDAPDSICPYGWRLPGESGSGSYYDLIQKYINRSGTVLGDGSLVAPILATPINLNRSGRYFNTVETQAAESNYWSNPSMVNDKANRLMFDDWRIYLNNAFGRGYGMSLRCLAR